MAQTVKAGAFLYRINPNNDKELQRCSIGASSWSRVCDFNGNLDNTTNFIRKLVQIRITLF
jgi:hypothetical protein